MNKTVLVMSNPPKQSPLCDRPYLLTIVSGGDAYHYWADERAIYGRSDEATTASRMRIDAGDRDAVDTVARNELQDLREMRNAYRKALDLSYLVQWETSA